MNDDDLARFQNTEGFAPPSRETVAKITEAGEFLKDLFPGEPYYAPAAGDAARLELSSDDWDVEVYLKRRRRDEGG